MLCEPTERPVLPRTRSSTNPKGLRSAEFVETPVAVFRKSLRGFPSAVKVTFPVGQGIVTVTAEHC
jgi:hypothetical protein